MTPRRLLLRNLRYFAASNIAVSMGVAVACAVLTGALLVGNAQRGSLRQRAALQQAGVEAALLRPRFFQATPDPQRDSFQVGLYLTGSCLAGADLGARRANQVVFLAGIDPGMFLNVSGLPSLPAMPRSLAEHLGLRVGDVFTAKMAVPATIPSESLLGTRDIEKNTLELTLQLASILDDETPVSQWRLQPGFGAPRNVYLPEDVLRRELAPFVSHLRSTERNSRFLGHNLIIAHGEAKALTESIRQRLSLNDFDLRWGTHPYFDAADLRTARKTLSLAEGRRRFVPEVAVAIDANHNQRLEPDEIRDWYRQHGYVSLESETGILSAEIVDVALRVAKELDVPASATLVYVANEIRSGEQSIPYSLIAAVDPELPAPLGPFLLPDQAKLADNEILLTAWPESPLRQLPIGSTIEVRYFRPELVDGRFVEQTARFRLAGYLPLTGAVLDPQLAPAFPGVTDRLNVRDWQPPFPYDNTRMQPRDEHYWQQYRTIPKAFITRSAGQKLWASRYGNATSVRLAVRNLDSVDDLKWEFERRFTRAMGQSPNWFVFDDLNARFREASVGGQDFGLLFLGFSMYLVISGILLVAMLSQLNVERRAGEIGLLQSIGWPLRVIRSVLLMEGLLIAVGGATFGLLAAILYAASMIHWLQQIWPDEQARSALTLHLTLTSPTVGFFATVIVGLATIHWATTHLARQATVRLLVGHIETEEFSSRPDRWRSYGWLIALALLGSGLLPLGLGRSVRDPMVRAGFFFVGGLIWLLALLWLFWLWLNNDKPAARLGQGWWAIARLGIRNARRHRHRSQLVCGLLAVATFLLVAVESFRRQPDRDFSAIDGGSGGFSLIIETALPVIRDWQRGDAPEILDHLQQAFQRQSGQGNPAERLAAAKPLLERTTIVSLRRSSGEDASCMNLYQARQPRMLGVPDALIQRGGFKFIQSLAVTPEERANPWLLLHTRRDAQVVPVIGEQNTVLWMLKKGLGDEWEMNAENGQPVRLRLVAVLKDSPFQSELVTSSADFHQLFPGTEGFRYHLVSCPPDALHVVAELLRQGLSPYEPEITRTDERVAAYMTVENTYLTTFQMLSGIGFVLGAFGLAVVVLRGIWERRAELALLRAVGYRQSRLGFLVLIENVWLFACGLTVGTLAAAVSVVPHTLLGGAIPWERLVLILGIVCLTGAISGWWTIRIALRRPLIPALRND
jgi:ABC-type lipoprotein release transport system permease subunit